MKNLFVLILFLVGCSPRVETVWKYELGDVLYYKTNTNKVGIITSVGSDFSGEPFYYVRFTEPTFETSSKSMFELISVKEFEIEKK